jgi:hypothetical protein
MTAKHTSLEVLLDSNHTPKLGTIELVRPRRLVGNALDRLLVPKVESLDAYPLGEGVGTGSETGVPEVFHGASQIARDVERSGAH